MSTAAPTPAPTVKAQAAEPAAGGAAAAEDLLAELGGPPKLWRWLATPLMLSTAVVALYVWVQGWNVTHRFDWSPGFTIPFTGYNLRVDIPTIEVTPPTLPFLDYAGRTATFQTDQALNATMVNQRIIEHLQLTMVSTFFVILVAVPLGALLTRPIFRRYSPIFLGFANIGQAVPSLGVLVLLAITFGLGFRYAVIALVIYATLPVLRNTMVGLDQVDESLIEAGRGMGLTSFQVLRRVEMPLAVPVMLAGIRTALIINVGTATLATYINAGGLGWIIDQGLRNRNIDIAILVTGSVLTAVLALALDWVAGAIEDILRPKGL